MQSGFAREEMLHFTSFAFPGKSSPSPPCNEQHYCSGGYVHWESYELLYVCQRKNVQNNYQCGANAIRLNLYFVNLRVYLILPCTVKVIFLGVKSTTLLFV